MHLAKYFLSCKFSTANYELQDVCVPRAISMAIDREGMVFPGLTIVLIVQGFNLLGDALRDALDPRLRGS